jgi:hypothetical protein
LFALLPRGGCGGFFSTIKNKLLSCVRALESSSSSWTMLRIGRGGESMEDRLMVVEVVVVVVSGKEEQFEKHGQRESERIWSSSHRARTTAPMLKTAGCERNGAEPDQHV